MCESGGLILSSEGTLHRGFIRFIFHALCVTSMEVGWSNNSVSASGEILVIGLIKDRESASPVVRNGNDV